MRLKPNVIKTYDSPNKSTRSDDIGIIVLHSTESHNVPGPQDLYGTASWLINPVAQASCHVIVDGNGNSVRIVKDEDKAWHCAEYNSVALGIEQIGFASYGKLNWIKKRKELEECARWLAHWSIKHDIPLRHSKINGVCMHKELGVRGGNHTDPGKYPIDKVLSKARKFKRKILEKQILDKE